MAKLIEVTVPNIGDFSNVAIIEILVKPGDRVQAEDSILTLESDKASVEIPSPSAGLVRELLVKMGDRVNAGDALLRLESDAGQEPSDPPAPDAAPAPSVPDQPPPAPPPRLPGEKELTPPPVQVRLSERPPGKAHASPGVRRLARELGVDLDRVRGAGPKGRILKEDVQAFVKQALRQGAAPAAAGPFQLPAAPEVDFSRFGPVRSQPLSRIRKLSGAHLHRAWLGAPQVTQFDQADITELDSFRRSQQPPAGSDQPRLTLLPFLVRACAAALQAMPRFNSSLAPDGDNLILKGYLNIGVAVDTPEGLTVPVLREVDDKGIRQIARELQDLSARARAGRLSPSDLQGGCFSISSLGGIGGSAFTPIVNAPEVAILGVSKAEWRPVWNGQEFKPRLMLPLSLSYDHRVIDGAEGARFTQLLSELLGDIRRLLL